MDDDNFSSGDDSNTVAASPTSWLTSLTGAVNTLAPVATTVAGIVKGSTAPSKPAASPSTTVAAAASGITKYLPYIIGGLVLIFGAVFFLRKK